MKFVSSMLSALSYCSLRLSSCTIFGIPVHCCMASPQHLSCLRQAWLIRLSLDGLAHRNLGRSSEISLTQKSSLGAPERRVSPSLPEAADCRHFSRPSMDALANQAQQKQNVKHVLSQLSTWNAPKKPFRGQPKGR